TSTATPKRARSSAALSSSVCRSRATSTRSAPRAASCRANSAPSPELAPVIRAVGMRFTLPPTRGSRPSVGAEPVRDAGARGEPAVLRIPARDLPARQGRGIGVAVDLEVDLGDLEHVGPVDRLGEELSPADHPDLAVAGRLQRLIQRPGALRALVRPVRLPGHDDVAPPRQRAEPIRERV